MRSIRGLLIVGILAVGASIWAHAFSTSSAQEPELFEVVLSAQSLRLEIPDSGGRTLGEVVGTVTAFADGEECANVDVSAIEDDVVLQLGLPGQPEACSTEGAVVNFQNDDGYWLSRWFTLEPGGQVVLETFAPIPPCEPNCTPPGPTEATSTPAPQTPTPTASPGTRPITPPDTGSAGLWP